MSNPRDSVSEITGMEAKPSMQDLPVCEGAHRESGNIHGSFRATGVRPNFLKS